MNESNQAQLPSEPRQSDAQSNATGVATRAPETGREPLAKIETTEAGFRLTLELPGADPDSVDVRVEGGLLTVTALRSPIDREGWKALLREIPTGGWRAGFRVPPDVDTDSVQASLASGVLILELARKSGRSIPIQTAREHPSLES